MIIIHDGPRQCAMCDHYDFVNLNCKAFPDKIPMEVRLGAIQHNSVLPDQIGSIVFSPISKEESEKREKAAEPERTKRVDTILDSFDSIEEEQHAAG